MRDIYIAIMAAAARDQGLRLTADECFNLSLDSAIYTAAANGLEPQDWPDYQNDTTIDWRKVDPKRQRVASNLTHAEPQRTVEPRDVGRKEKSA